MNVYRGYRGSELLGYAFIDVHNVRTHPEAFLVVLSPEGAVESLRVLAFHEPLEYMPTDRWYEQFQEKSLPAPAAPGRRHPRDRRRHPLGSGHHPRRAPRTSPSTRWW